MINCSSYTLKQTLFMKMDFVFMNYANTKLYVLYYSILSNKLKKNK